MHEWDWLGLNTIIIIANRCIECSLLCQALFWRPYLLNLLILLTLWNTSYYIHCTDDKSEAHRDNVTYSKPHNCWVIDPEFKLRQQSSGSRPIGLNITPSWFHRNLRRMRYAVAWYFQNRYTYYICIWWFGSWQWQVLVSTESILLPFSSKICSVLHQTPKKIIWWSFSDENLKVLHAYNFTNTLGFCKVNGRVLNLHLFNKVYFWL